MFERIVFLARQIKMIYEDGGTNADPTDVEELVTMVIELDAWHRGAGFLPEPWTRPE